MTPIVTVWPTKAMGDLSLYVDRKVRDEGFDDGTYLNVDYSATVSNSFANTLQQAFRQLISINASVATLNVVAIVPLYEKGSDVAVVRLANVIARQANSYALHVLGLQSGLAHVLGGQEDRTTERNNIGAIARTLAAQNFRAYPIVVDDYLASGAPVNFDMPLLARFVAALLRTMGENYDSAFPNVPVTNRSTVLSMGLSQARFDRSVAVDYMLHRAFTEAVERVGILQAKVNTPAAEQRAQQHLGGASGFFDKVYAERVVPELEKHTPEADIAAAIPPLIKADVAQLKSDMTSFIDDDTLSLPEKESTFALLLGQDNARIKGYLFNGIRKEFDDVLTVPLDIYIDSYNALASDTGLLPGRKECNLLKLPDLGSGQNTQPNPENEKACNPLPILKSLKGEMFDLTSFIRRQQEQLKKLHDIVQGQYLQGKILVGNGVFRKSNYDIVEQPLKDKYVPAADLVIKKTVDMRALCSPIRDQGALGSCSSFAVTAMYEIIVNAENADTKIPSNLSERYLFYHSNVVTGRINGGSNFGTQLEVMGKHGICSEVLYPYTTTNLSVAPSNDADTDAQKHRVLCAKQIDLKRDGTKYDNITENHRLLTSALSEGYAVGFSLKIFDNFGKEPGGFVSLPTQPGIKEDGHHAMVIVGYSESTKCYIVRNSWGVAFGDKGYCYISSVYVDDPDYINFACIITDTTEKTAGIVNAPSTTTVNLGASTTLAQVAATTNTIDEAKIHLEWLKDRYNDLFGYYALLQQKTAIPATRNVIRAKREAQLEAALEAKKEYKQSLIASFPQRLKELKDQYRNRCIGTTVAALALIIISVILSRTGVASVAVIISGVFAAIAVVAAVLLWANLGMEIRRYRKELQDEINRVAVEEAELKRAFLENQIRFYTAGIVIDEVSSMKLDLEKRYQSLVSYNKNLAQWYKEDKEKQGKLANTLVNQGLFINLIDRRLLDKYFQDNLPQICKNIDLVAEFKKFKLTETALQEALQQLRDNLEKTTRGVLRAMFDTFSVCDYIMQTQSYPYLDAPDNTAMFNDLNQLAQPATRHNSANAAAVSRCLAIYHRQNDANALRAVYGPMFAMMPQLLNTADKEALTVIVSTPIQINSLI